jgi:peptide-methionine (S)-S-oxide reductase
MERDMIRNPKNLWRLSAVSAAAVLGAYLAGLFGGTVAKGAEFDQRLPAPVVDEAPKGPGTETLVLAGGCFWGI